MVPDHSPEALADYMKAEQRVKQFVIRDPYPVFEIIVMVIAVLMALVVVHYAEQIERILAGWGI